MKTLLTLLMAACALNLCAAPEPNQQREITVSNTVYTVKYSLKSTQFYSVTLTLPPGPPHYDCTAVVFSGTNKLATIETQWTEKGCFEDSPLMLVGRALAWKRYPNDSAGKGLHWVVSGAAMYAESDDL